MISLIHPKLQFQHALTKQVNFIEPLEEIQLQEGAGKDGLNFLDPELVDIIKHSTKIQKQYRLQPQRLGFLHGLIIALFTHMWRLRGHQSVPGGLLDALQSNLEDYSLENLQQFFESNVAAGM